MVKARGVSFEKMEQAILAAAGDLFDEKGFNQTSLQDIAQALGMSRPSLYHYFDNREQILGAGVQLLTDERNALVEELRSVEGDPVQRLTALMLGLSAHVTAHPVWVRIALREEAALADDFRERDRASRLAYFDLLVATLKDSIELGYVRPHDERAMAVTIISSISGLRSQYAATSDQSPEQRAQLTVDIILNGVLAPERRDGTPLERGLELIREGAALIQRSGTSA
jgi:AcrR family transcriptional regulator